eukprot:g32995.t1
MKYSETDLDAVPIRRYQETNLDEVMADYNVTSADEPDSPHYPNSKLGTVRIDPPIPSGGFGQDRTTGNHGECREEQSKAAEGDVFSKLSSTADE